MSELMRTVVDVLLPSCPQCQSRECGPYRCRMSGMTHALFRENNYANAMVKRDKEQPAWLRDVLTGAKESQ